MQLCKSWRVVLSSIILLLLFLIIACGDSDDLATLELAALEGTLEVKIVAEGLEQPMHPDIDLDAEKFRDNVFVPEFDAGRVTAINLNDGTRTILVNGLAGPGGVRFGVLPDVFLVVESLSNRIRFVDISDSDNPKVTTAALLPQGVFPVSITEGSTFRFVVGNKTTEFDKYGVYNISANAPKEIAEGCGRAVDLTHRVAKRPELLVVDSKEGAVFRIEIDAGSDEVITKLDRFIDKLNNPTAIAIGPSGAIYLALSGDGVILRFDANGRNPETVAQIEFPTALTFTSNATLLVTTSDGKILSITGAEIPN